MSNLIKSVYFNMNPEGSRVIDSDSQVEQFIPAFFHQPEETEEIDAPDFQVGMSVLNMEDVRQEERRKVEQEASEQMNQILEQARQEASDILQQAEIGAQAIRDQAAAEGRNQGFAEGKAEAEALLREEEEKLRQKWLEEKRKLEEEAAGLEPKFADIMAMLIEKITGVVCQDKKEIIVYLIHQAMNQLERTNSVILRVSKEDILSVSGKRAEWKSCLPENVELDIVEDDSLQATQCIIETDNKIIDCSLDIQLQNLKEQIKLLTIL